jgi:hypothetical protein
MKLKVNCLSQISLSPNPIFEWNRTLLSSLPQDPVNIFLDVLLDWKWNQHPLDGVSFAHQLSDIFICINDLNCDYDANAGLNCCVDILTNVYDVKTIVLKVMVIVIVLKTVEQWFKETVLWQLVLIGYRIIAIYKTVTKLTLTFVITNVVNTNDVVFLLLTCSSVFSTYLSFSLIKMISHIFLFFLIAFSFAQDPHSILGCTAGLGCDDQASISAAKSCCLNIISDVWNACIDNECSDDENYGQCVQTCNLLVQGNSPMAP